MKKGIITIPNILSLFRLLLLPVYAYIYLNAETATDFYIAGGIFILSALTDMADGFIARKFNMISRFGKILDPVADKVTQGIIMICLAIEHSSVWMLFAFFVLKEGFMTVMGLINLKKGKMLNGAKFIGKVCTTVLFISMIIMVLFHDISQNIINSLIIISSFFMLCSFVSYIIVYFKHPNKLEDITEG